MIFIKLIQIKKKKSQISQKKKVKMKNKKNNIKIKFIHVKEKYKLLKKLKDNINNQQKVYNILQINLLQLQFNYSQNLPNILMDYVKINVHIVKSRTKS